MAADDIFAPLTLPSVADSIEPSTIQELPTSGIIENIATASQVADALIIWAKKHGLFSKDAAAAQTISDDEIYDSIEISPLEARQNDVRRAAINFIVADDQNRTITICTNRKLNQKVTKLLPKETTTGVKLKFRQAILPQAGGIPLPAHSGPYTIRGNKYCCGSSIYVGNQIGAGTFGAILKAADGTLYGLSNNHVSGGCNHAESGTPILAPGPHDISGTSINPFTIGRHSKVLPMLDGHHNIVDINMNTDVAIFKLEDPALVSSYQGSAYDTPSACIPIHSKMNVEKVGRTTGHTIGTVIGPARNPIPVTYLVDSPQKGKKVVYFHQPYAVSGLIEPFSQPGDSGSLVTHIDPITNIRMAVGLVFAGGGEDKSGTTFILPLHSILASLNMELVAGHNV